MADFDDWDADGGGRGGGSGPAASADDRTSVVRAGLLDPATFPSPRSRLAPDAPSVEPQAPEITGPLRTSIHDEVLQDILNAQARLPKPLPETWTINGQPYLALSAENFDSTLSDHMTSMPTPADSAAAFAGRSLVAVPFGDEERAGYIAHAPSRVVPVRGIAGGGDGFATYTYKQPINSPPIHGHVDHSSDPSKVSEGFVDSTKAKKGLGDAWSLFGQHP